MIVEREDRPPWVWNVLGGQTTTTMDGGRRDWSQRRATSGKHICAVCPLPVVPPHFTHRCIMLARASMASIDWRLRRTTRVDSTVVAPRMLTYFCRSVSVKVRVSPFNTSNERTRASFSYGDDYGKLT